MQTSAHIYELWFHLFDQNYKIQLRYWWGFRKISEWLYFALLPPKRLIYFFEIPFFHFVLGSNRVHLNKLNYCAEQTISIKHFWALTFKCTLIVQYTTGTEDIKGVNLFEPNVSTSANVNRLIGNQNLVSDWGFLYTGIRHGKNISLCFSLNTIMYKEW